MTPNQGKELLLQVPCDVALQATTLALIATTETSTLHHGDDMSPFLDCSVKAIPNSVENYSGYDDDDDDDGKIPALTDHNRGKNEDLGEDKDETTKNVMGEIITKLAHFVSIIVEVFHFTRGQKQKVYRIVNHCEDAKQKGHYYNGEQNCLEQQKRCM
eukprot:4887548-Ditylum_brightwellii.AAC.1